MENFSKDEVLVQLAQRIKVLRKQKGVSQQNAYNDTGIHFARIEQGKRDINYSTLLRICVYFEVSLKDFFNQI
ncbi:helix-turn-helix domain-containing protein [Flavivirga spongiicola]|uniref:Helix-turn-helix domain-containing protein n=1 Tax=Flavivirga spongiicola TaxID=421621 RepID=A0ABU7XUV0_9FLAO|nr:helix-turn-helix transcriptional regulator [Flavivirga sp. MEBiC05379]MDO5979204.1 helix-turn-helix transcriptional regulator [Flavivirga sp. MEBiC05379]